ILPTVWGSPGFGAPKFVPQEFNRTRDIVQGLAADRAALLILDYEPGYSAELESVAGPFLQDLRQRQLKLVTLTTRPASIALGPRLLARHGFVAGEDVVHLGYLAGGMTAVRLFSDSPRAAFPGQFEDPENAKLLGPIERLSDASALVVISSSGERARVWAEQAPPLLGNAPLMMILSAGAEPLVRPYYEAPNPQVDALLTGLPAAMAYEQAMGQPMEASSRWSAFGMGLLTAQGALLVGAVVGLVRWLLALRKK
ncbi:MAG TPA: hypothetical protein VJ123_05465, partial [Anaerolineales bacterium]|nr:hypothetical protein [Anaerolineales bacterium]